MNIYHNIPELKRVNKEYRDLKRTLSNHRNKVKSLYARYSFIEEVVSSTIDDIKLEESVKKLFDDVGYSAKQPPEKRDLDVIASSSNGVIGIEVKNDRNVGENEMFQALKYVGRHRSKGNEMHPLMIWNNSKTNQEFDQYRIHDAVNHKYGILTTKELLKGYFKLKQEKITFDLFDRLINQIGLIEFSNTEIKRMKSSVVVEDNRSRKAD